MSSPNNKEILKKVSDKNEAAEKERSADTKIGGSPKNSSTNDTADTRKRSPNNEPTIETQEKKRVRKEETEEEIIDKAAELGFKAGDKLVVEWEVGEEPNVVKHDWPATLMEWDGRTKEGFAIRMLDYDPFLPDFPERSQEEAVFVTKNVMIRPSDGVQMDFHREGEDPIIEFREEDLDLMVANTLSKKSDMWKKLSPAQQAHLGDVINRGKESLLETIHTRWEENPGKVISAEEVPEIMKQAFEGIM